MPAIDPNSNRSRKEVRTSNKKKATTVRKARTYLTKPAAKGSTPAPRTDLPSGASTEAARTERKHVDKQVKTLTDKGGSLRKKSVAVHELARLGLLPKGYLTGLEQRRRDDIELQAKREREAAERLHAVEMAARAHGYGDMHGPEVPTSLKYRGPDVEKMSRQDLEELAKDYHGGFDVITPAAKAYFKLHPQQRVVADPEPADDAPEHVKKAWEKKHGKFSTAKYERASSLDRAVGGAIPGLVNSAGALVEGVARDPIGVPAKTAKQAAAAIPAIVGGVAQLVQHPVKTTKASIKDYGDRANESYDDKLKRIRKEGGFAEVADLTALVSGGASAAAKTTMLGKLERAAVRTSGDIVKPRRKAGLAKTVVGAKLDKRRGAKLARELAAAEGGGKAMDAVRHKAAETNRKAGRTVEVVPRRAGAAQVRDVAKQKSRAVYGLKSDQGTRIAAATKTMNRLSKAEKRALYYAAVFGIRTADHAREILPQLAHGIAAKRTEDGVRVTGSLRKSDMLPDIEKMLADPEAHFTTKLGEVVEDLRHDSERAGREDPRLFEGIARDGEHYDTAEQRRHAPLAALLDLHQGEKPHVNSHGVPELRKHDESADEYLVRVAKTIEAKGLASPLYFKSERYTGPLDFAARAVGGKRAMAHDKTYEGKNLAVGLQDTTPAQYVRGLARNIKAKHNWNLVADILDSHAITGLAPKAGSTISHLRASLHERGIDENSIAYWNPGIYRAAARADAGDVDTPDARFDAGDSVEVGDALSNASVEGSKGTPAHLRTTHGWHVVPIKALRELEAQSVPSGVVGRSLDIVKGKSSRAILLAGNVPWASFQVASNIGMTAAATGGRALNPANWVGTARWWKALSDEEKRNAGAHLGLDTSNADLHQVRLGASTNSDLVNAYRALKAHPFWHTGVVAGHGPTISQLNPMELMAAFDRTQNNAFRKLAGYSLAKREAVKRMGEEMGAADHAQAKVASILGMPPIDQLRAIARDKDVLEEHGEKVADWMGDYTTLTAAERKVLNRSVMFYPYMRYSLKLVFYTLPVKHPAVSAILAEIGQLHAEEVKEIFGSDQMFWNLGKVYFGDKGNVKEIDLRKANPALNAIFDSLGTGNPYQGTLGVLPPYAGWLFDQVTHRSNFADREWRIKGHAGAYGAKSKDYGPIFEVFQPGSTRNRILAKSMLSLAYPYRTVDKELNPGTLGDDSLAFAPQPTKFKGRDAASKLSAKFADRREGFEQEHKSWAHTLVPLIPAPSRDVENAREAAILKKANAPGKKHRAKPRAYFGGGSTSTTSKPKLFGSK